VRTPIIAGNWKMNYGPDQARDFTAALMADLQGITTVERVLCPPFVSLPAVAAVTRGSDIRLGAQNMYFEEKGAYTGEIAPGMLEGLCSYVILGHSERRGYFGETDDLVNRKTRAALAHGLRPIVCIGERLEQYEAGETEEVVTTQVHGSLGGLPRDQMAQVVVAYEPIWAIGTGKAATADGANAVIQLIRRTLGELYGDDVAQEVRIQYGGSVTAANIADFVAYTDIDGALVGGASLKPEFIEIVRQTADAKARR
jgi:triosephosphate isomerase